MPGEVLSASLFIKRLSSEATRIPDEKAGNAVTQSFVLLSPARSPFELHHLLDCGVDIIAVLLRRPAA